MYFCGVKKSDEHIDVSAGEAGLIRQIKKGNILAFNVLYKLYFNQIYSYSLQFTKSKHDAEDIVQEVFTQLWVNREKITAEDSVKALLFVIARNFLVRSYRKNINSPFFEDYMECCNNIAHHDVSLTEYDEFVASLNKYISELPDKQRQILLLSKFEGLTNKEIAHRIGIGEQTVKNYLSLGLKYLRERIRPLLSAIIAIAAFFRLIL